MGTGSSKEYAIVRKPKSSKRRKNIELFEHTSETAPGLGVHYHDQTIYNQGPYPSYAQAYAHPPYGPNYNSEAVPNYNGAHARESGIDHHHDYFSAHNQDKRTPNYSDCHAQKQESSFSPGYSGFQTNIHGGKVALTYHERSNGPAPNYSATARHEQDRGHMPNHSGTHRKEPDRSKGRRPIHRTSSIAKDRVHEQRKPNYSGGYRTDHR